MQGVMSLSSLSFMRPVPGYADYRTPVRGLYLCGAATHPGGGVMGACGYQRGAGDHRGIARRLGRSPRSEGGEAVRPSSVGERAVTARPRCVQPDTALTVPEGLARLPGPAASATSSCSATAPSASSCTLRAAPIPRRRTPGTRCTSWCRGAGSSGTATRGIRSGRATAVRAGGRGAPVRGVHRRSRRLGVLLRPRGRRGERG